MEELIERYEILSKDVKFKIDFIDDFYQFDFDHLNKTLEEMKEIQIKLRNDDNI